MKVLSVRLLLGARSAGATKIASPKANSATSPDPCQEADRIQQVQPVHLEQQTQPFEGAPAPDHLFLDLLYLAVERPDLPQARPSPCDKYYFPRVCYATVCFRGRNN
jgi:hypothetical protein